MSASFARVTKPDGGAERRRCAITPRAFRYHAAARRRVDADAAAPSRCHANISLFIDDDARAPAPPAPTCCIAFIIFACFCARARAPTPRQRARRARTLARASAQQRHDADDYRALCALPPTQPCRHIFHATPAPRMPRSKSKSARRYTQAAHHFASARFRKPRDHARSSGAQARAHAAHARARRHTLRHQRAARF